MYLALSGNITAVTKIRNLSYNTSAMVSQSQKGGFCMESYEHEMLRKPGYAYVPPQRMDKVYPPNKALKAGTIFPELNITLEEYERGLYNGK